MSLLVVLTVLEVVLFLGAVVLYLVLINRRLRGISSVLGKVAFGVRAVESQTAPLGPSLETVNRGLETVNRDLEVLGEALAEPGGGAPPGS